MNDEVREIVFRLLTTVCETVDLDSVRIEHMEAKGTFDAFHSCDDRPSDSDDINPSIGFWVGLCTVAWAEEETRVHGGKIRRATELKL